MAEAWFEELAEFIRIPSISADPAHATDVVRAGEWVRDRVRDAGGEADVIEWQGQPLALGEGRAANGAGGAPPARRGGGGGGGGWGGGGRAAGAGRGARVEGRGPRADRPLLRPLRRP